MSYCPSQDWDRYCNEQDEAAAAEVAWWKENSDRVLQVVCAAIASGKTVPLEEMDAKDMEQLVTISGKVVEAITYRKEDA